MNLNILNQLILPNYEEKLKNILDYIIPTIEYDFNNIKWVLCSTRRSLCNTPVDTVLLGEITGSDIACCDIANNTINITNYTLKQNDSFIIEVILHELAHIISGKKDHEKCFKDCYNCLVETYNKKTEGSQVLSRLWDSWL